MTDKEKAELDLKTIEVFKRKASSDFAQYQSLVLEKYPSGRVRLWIDEAKVLYHTTSLFEMHLLGGIEDAIKLFEMKGLEEDKLKALKFQEVALQGTNKAVMKYKQGNTLAICNDFKEVFTNGSLLRLMCQRTYPAAKAELQKIINS